MSRGDTFLAGFERRALRSCALLAIPAAALALLEPRWVPIAYRLAVFTCLAPSLGALILALIHRTTGGQWTEGLAPFLAAAITLLPWVWLLLFPLLALRWPLAPAEGGGWLAYDGRFLTLLRFLGAAGIFFMPRHWLRDGLGSVSEPSMDSRTWVGPAGLVITFLTLTLVADDWLESLEPGWHSTAFPLVWMTSQVVFALSLALLLGLACGLKPSRSGGAGRPLGLDWGDLLLATVMFWAYVAFCQFLIIWAGNLPEETSWFIRREQGGWKWVVPAIAVLGFAVPFLALLSRRLKRRTGGLALVAGLILVAQWAFLMWVILPAGGLPSMSAIGLAAALVGAIASLVCGPLRPNGAAPGGAAMSAEHAPRPGHEATDASPRTVAALAGALAFLVALGIAAGVETVRLLSGGAAHASAATSFAGGSDSRPAVEVSWDQCERASAARLGGYAWVDRRAGTVRIPLERAMDLVAAEAGEGRK